MSEPPLIERELTILARLASQAEERAAGEAKHAGDLATKGTAIESEGQTARADLDAKARRALREIERASEEERQSLKAESDVQREAIQKDHDSAVKTYKARYQAESQKAKADLEEARWQATAVFESGMESAKKAAEAAQRTLTDVIQTRLAIEAEANALLTTYRRYVGSGEMPPMTTESTTEAATDPRPGLEASICRMDEHVIAIHKLKSLKVLRLDTFAFIAVFTTVALGVPASLKFGWPGGAIAAVILAVVLVAALRVWLVSVARRGVTAIALPLLPNFPLS